MRWSVSWNRKQSHLMADRRSMVSSRICSTPVGGTAGVSLSRNACAAAVQHMPAGACDPCLAVSSAVDVINPTALQQRECVPRARRPGNRQQWSLPHHV